MPGSLVGGTVTAEAGPWDVERMGLPVEVEPRVSGGGQCYDRVLLTPRPGFRPSLQARLVAVSLAGRAFSAVRRPRSRADEPARRGSTPSSAKFLLP